MLNGGPIDTVRHFVFKTFLKINAKKFFISDKSVYIYISIKTKTLMKTLASLITSLTEYAKEDLEICMEAGSSAITYTAFGVLWLEYNATTETFIARDGKGKMLQEGQKDSFSQWMINNVYTLD